MLYLSKLFGAPTNNPVYANLLLDCKCYCVLHSCQYWPLSNTLGFVNKSVTDYSLAMSKCVSNHSQSPSYILIADSVFLDFRKTESYQSCISLAWSTSYQCWCLSIITHHLEIQGFLHICHSHTSSWSMDLDATTTTTTTTTTTIIIIIIIMILDVVSSNNFSCYLFFLWLFSFGLIWSDSCMFQFPAQAWWVWPQFTIPIWSRSEIDIGWLCNGPVHVHKYCGVIVCCWIWWKRRCEAGMEVLGMMGMGKCVHKQDWIWT